MKKFVPLTFVPVLAFACTPDIAQDSHPDPNASIEVLFDPGATVPVVPAPNDLAKDQASGKLKVPNAPGASDAQIEFNAYLNTLDNFPFESTASVTTSGDLDPASVNAANVIVIDITNPAAPAPAMGYTPSFANKTISIAPPKGGWTRGHHYAVALFAGDGGLKGAAGQKVHGSSTFALVSGPNPLVTCPDLKTNCRPTVDIIPSTETDPERRLADQTAKAVQLEQIRLGYKPILDALAGSFGKPRETIPIVWTFGITDSAEVLFDPANNVIPFPNDVLLDQTTKKIKLPNPETFAPLAAADCAAPKDSNIALVCGLNTLDGFSTTVPLLSENSADLGALEQGTLDAASLTKASVGLAKVKSDGATSATDPNWQPCINCGTSNPAATTQTLQWNLLAPLDEKSTYFAYVTTDVKDDKQKNVSANPVFALVRSSKTLVTADGHAAVSIISDDQAKQLEPLRAAMAPAFDALAAKGLTRDKIALAFAFTTQSEGAILDQLRKVPPGAIAAGLPDYPVVFQDATAQYTAGAAAKSIPITAINKFYGGAFYGAVAVTGPSGTLNPTAPRLLPIPFFLAIPKGTMPAGGWPVTIFGHGLGGSRNDTLAIANALAAAGQVVISIDTLDHGDRTSCTGAAAPIIAAGKAPAGSPDDIICADPATQKCDEDPVYGSCVLRDDTKRSGCEPGPLGDASCTLQGQGRCVPDKKCQGAGAAISHQADGSVAVSGFNYFNISNFFATRDNFRQHVIDLETLVLVLKSANAKSLQNQLKAGLADPAFAINAASINYAGQSLGSILGALFNAVSPDTNNVAFNVGGGSLVKLFLDSPTLASQKAALVAALGKAGVQPGSPQFDQVLGFAQWILDEADPVNVAYRLTHPANGAPNANRKVLLQFIKDDQFVINESNFALVASANREFNATAPPSFGCTPPLNCYEFIDQLDGFDTTSGPLAARHSFLLKPMSDAALPVTQKAQFQVANFIATGAFKATP